MSDKSVPLTHKSVRRKQSISIGDSLGRIKFIMLDSPPFLVTHALQELEPKYSQDDMGVCCAGS